MVKGKKFIAPGSWFSMTYPAAWNEFDAQDDDAFLFYDADQWSGNFRISAFRGARPDYGECTVRDELRQNRNSQPVKVGNLTCAYSSETFHEDGNEYRMYQWVAGIDDIAFEITFSTGKDTSTQPARDIIATLEVRHPGVKYPAEVIPVRVSEMYLIDAAYAYVEDLVKQNLKKDFRGEEADVQNMQRIVDSGSLNRRKRDSWIDMGITLCVIAGNEADGYEWHTLIDGNREDPVLVDTATGRVIDPLKLVWSRVKNGEDVDLAAAYDSIFGQEAGK